MDAQRLDLLVVADSVEGGLGAAAVAHAQWFAARGWTVLLAAPGVHAPQAAPAQALDLRVPHGAADVRGMATAARALRRILRSSRPRIVHAHGTRSELVTLAAGRRPHVTMHGSGGRISGQSGLGATVRDLSRRAASLLAAEAYSAAPSPGRWRTTLVASPRLGSLELAPVAAMAAKPTFLWVGRMDEPKRPDVFVQAVAHLARRLPVRGVMLGDGPLIDDVRALVSREAAPVDVLGAEADLAPHLASAWGVALFSGFEGVPFSVQEAMWTGRAVVLSPLPTLRWFAGGAASYAVDAATAADALETLCDRDVAAECGARCAVRVRELLDAEAPFPELLRAYGTVRR